MAGRIFSLLLSFVLALHSTAALAEVAFQFSMPGVQAPRDPDVNGARLAFLYGKNNSVHGFDLGLAAISDIANRSGFSANVGLSRVSGRSSGCSGSLINIHNGSDSGLNAAFINVIETMTDGLNVGFVNIAEGYSKMDFGGLSLSSRSDVQIGFVNVTKEIRSFQFGFLNFADNGFFPVFPVVNFPKSK